jgi:type VII secretion integral membrane protein EccD
VTSVTTPVGLGLARVTVAAPKRRIDVALPDNALVAELLPHLLRHAGEDLADAGEAHGGWVLRRATGARLEPTRNLAVQGVRDGEILELVPARVDWPELAYDDVVEVIVGGARRGRSWGHPATRRCGLAVTAAVLGLGLVEVLLSGPPWPFPAGVALGVAGVLAVAGILLSRAFADAGAGAVVAAAGLPYAFLGGALLVAPSGTPLTHLGAPDLLAGSTTLLVASVVGYTGVAAVHRLFMAGLAAGLTGLLAALLSLAGTSTAGAAAVTLTVVIGLLPGYPLIAGSLGKLPVPELPDRPEAILEDRPVPPRSQVFAAVARSAELLAGMLLSASVVSVVAMVALITTGSLWAWLLAFSGAAALLLRGRLFPTPAERIPLLAGGLIGLASLLFGATLRANSHGARLALLLVILAVAGLVLASGLTYSRRNPSPYVGRIADILDVVAILALIPLACGVVGVYQAIQNLFASFGG